MFIYLNYVTNVNRQQKKGCLTKIGLDCWAPDGEVGAALAAAFLDCYSTRLLVFLLWWLC